MAEKKNFKHQTFGSVASILALAGFVPSGWWLASVLKGQVESALYASGVALFLFAVALVLYRASQLYQEVHDIQRRAQILLLNRELARVTVKRAEAEVRAELAEAKLQVLQDKDLTGDKSGL